jgi:predicted 3-demethylubiquinone-9 3-methyltransferase (glyoxalase superfamily)
MIRPKITPFLWFDHQAEEAANFYVSLFPDAAITGITPGPTGAPLVVEFRLAGVQFSALNGGPHYKLTEAFSLSVDCHSQAEVDDLWEKLSAGGEKSHCGWLKDKFGLSWQVVPAKMIEWMSDPATAHRVMTAVFAMKKLDVAALEQAAAG